MSQLPHWMNDKPIDDLEFPPQLDPDERDQAADHAAELLVPPDDDPSLPFEEYHVSDVGGEQ